MSYDYSLKLMQNVDNVEWEEIYPNIIVYRNMLSDPQKAFSIMEKSESSSHGKYFFRDWTKWAHFGTYTEPKDPDEIKQNAEYSDMFYEEKNLFDEIAISYQKAISHYFEYTKILLPEGARFSGQSWCKYFNKIDILKNNMTMQYHTDFIISEKDMPGDKYHTTCTFYINDNYDGGEVEFYINGDIVCHKPKAGDIVVFPSTEPYFHGVKTIPSGNKYMIRNFVVYNYAGSEEWLQKQRRYGAYKWSKTEFERIEYENPRNMLYLQNNKIVSFDEIKGNE